MNTENWIRYNTLKDFKDRAKRLVEKDKAEHEGKQQITIPHPTIKKTYILKYI
jgi:hypothetical protein